MRSKTPSGSSAVNSHTHEQLVGFLREADRALSSNQRLVIIGGAAALLNYGAIRPTADIDTIEPLTAELERAFDRAREQTGLDIPVQSVGIYDTPYDFEERI